MIDQKKNDAIDLRWNAAQGRLNRTQLAFLPILIDHDFVGGKIYFPGDGLGVGAENHAAHTNLGMTCDAQQVLEKRAPLIGEKRFWRSHAAGCAAREDDGSEHATSFSVESSRDENRKLTSCVSLIRHCGEWR